jgi:hypothetical protein
MINIISLLVKCAKLKLKTMSKEEFYKYGESLGIKINDLQRLKMLAMADKKYPEEDMIKAILFGMQKGLNVGKVDETDNDWVNNYINSINKQD